MLKRSDSNKKWRFKVEPILTYSSPYKSYRLNWDNIERRVFRALLVRIALRERSSWPGAVRYYWRKKRLEAAKYYETKWGYVPPVLYQRHVPQGLALFRSEGWNKWARE